MTVPSLKGLGCHYELLPSTHVLGYDCGALRAGNCGIPLSATFMPYVRHISDLRHSLRCRAHRTFLFVGKIPTPSKSSPSTSSGQALGGAPACERRLSYVTQEQTTRRMAGHPASGAPVSPDAAYP